MSIPSRSWRIALLLLPVACAGNDAFDVEPADELETALGVSCTGVDQCFGQGGDVYTSLYRVGATTGARAEIVQFFMPSAGTPAELKIALRKLRPFSASRAVHVQILDLTSSSGPVSGAAIEAATPLASASLDAGASFTSGVATFTFSGASPLAQREYALRISTDDVGASEGSLLLGVGALQQASNGYAGATLRRVQRGTTGNRTEGTPSVASSADVAFALKHAASSFTFPSGLVGYWKLDETGGSRADTSSSGLPLVESAGSVAGATGQFGGAARFTTNALLQIPAATFNGSPADVSGNALSVMAWARADQLVGGQILGHVRHCVSSHFHMRVESNGRIEAFLGAVDVSSNAGLVSGSGWHHYAMTYDGQTVRLLFDGNVVRSVAAALGSVRPSAVGTDLPFTVGGWASQSYCPVDFPWRGDIDEVAIFNTALSSGEVNAVRGHTTPPTAAAGLVGHWKLDENSGPRADTAGTGIALLESSGTIGAAAGTFGQAAAIRSASHLVIDPTTYNGSAVDLSGPQMTAVAWARAQSLNGGQIVGHVRHCQISHFHIRVQGNGAIEAFLAGLNVSSGAGVVTTGGWHQYALTYDGTAARLYFDGNVVATTAASLSSVRPGNIGDVPFTVGGWQAQPYCNVSFPWDGDIDEVALYSTALSASALNALNTTGVTP